MAARRSVREALKSQDAEDLSQARSAVDDAKRALGERGPAWWTDGAPDFNRRMARNTPYADWFASLDASAGSSSNDSITKSPPSSAAGPAM
jgi:hypothetical protein